MRKSKKIHLEEIDGVVVPIAFRDRFYDRRKHKGRLKECSCGKRFYDETPRVTSELCYDCTINTFSSKTDLDFGIARSDPLRHKFCRLCGAGFVDVSMGRSRRYCLECSAKHSYDILSKLVLERGEHPNFVDVRTSEFDALVLKSYDGIKSDVQIASEVGLSESQARFVRKRLGLETVTYDNRRVFNGKPSLKSLDHDKLVESISKHSSYDAIANEYGVKRSTIKREVQKQNIDRVDILFGPIGISKTASDIIIGHLLGDGCLIPTGKKKAAYFKVLHKAADRLYTEWSRDQLLTLNPKIRPCKKFVDGKLFHSFSYSTQRTSSLIPYFNDFYDKSLLKKFGAHGTKCPKIKIFENLSDLSLAIWYMDDGSYSDEYPNIAMNFPGSNYDEIVDALTKRFGFPFYYVKRKTCVLLKIRTKIGRDKFFEIITPYIHERMSRKLHPKFRTPLAYAEDFLSSKIQTSAYFASDANKKTEFLDSATKTVLSLDYPAKRLTQGLDEYLNDLQERLSRCRIKEDRSLEYLQDGLAYLDTIFLHRFTSNHSGELSFKDAWKDETTIRKALSSLLNRNIAVTTTTLTSRIMELISAPGHFRPSVASTLINHYKPKSVYDPFIGWGGRSLACLLSKHVDNYVGTDLQESSVHSVRRMVQDMQKVSHGSSVVHHVNALTHMSSTTDRFDMILAGPPYFDVEEYDGVNQVGSFTDWTKSFIEPFCELSSKILNPKGLLALHIFDTHKYQFIEPFMFALRKFGLTHVEQFKVGYLKNTKRSQYIHLFKHQ